MAVDVASDYEDVYDFVQEDEEVETADNEDEIESRIAVEHVKFLEAQARWQEQIRASRPWSAPPLSSPRPLDQKQREEEAKQIAQTLALGVPVAGITPRQDFVPPERPYLKKLGVLALTQAGMATAAAAVNALNSALSYLTPPRPASAGSTSRRSSRFSISGTPRPLQGIAEEPSPGAEEQRRSGGEDATDAAALSAPLSSSVGARASGGILDPHEAVASSAALNPHSQIQSLDQDLGLDHHPSSASLGVSASHRAVADNGVGDGGRWSSFGREGGPSKTAEGDEQSAGDVGHPSLGEDDWPVHVHRTSGARDEDDESQAGLFAGLPPVPDPLVTRPVNDPMPSGRRGFVEPLEYGDADDDDEDEYEDVYEDEVEEGETKDDDEEEGVNKDDEETSAGRMSESGFVIAEDLDLLESKQPEAEGSAEEHGGGQGGLLEGLLEEEAERLEHSNTMEDGTPSDLHVTSDLLPPECGAGTVSYTRDFTSFAEEEAAEERSTTSAQEGDERGTPASPGRGGDKQGHEVPKEEASSVPWDGSPEALSHTGSAAVDAHSPTFPSLNESPAEDEDQESDPHPEEQSESKITVPGMNLTVDMETFDLPLVPLPPTSSSPTGNAPSPKTVAAAAAALAGSARVSPSRAPLARPIPVPEPQEDEEENAVDVRFSPAAATVWTSGGRPSLSAPAPVDDAASASTGNYGDLLHPHDFAIQLLKHDIEAWPAHHRAQQITAAVPSGPPPMLAKGSGGGGASRQRPWSAQAPSSSSSTALSLGKYGYLGYYTKEQDVSAMSPEQGSSASYGRLGKDAAKAVQRREAMQSQSGATRLAAQEQSPATLVTATLNLDMLDPDNMIFGRRPVSAPPLRLAPDGLTAISGGVLSSSSGAETKKVATGAPLTSTFKGRSRPKSARPPKMPQYTPLFRGMPGPVQPDASSKVIGRVGLSSILNDGSSPAAPPADVVDIGRALRQMQQAKKADDWAAPTPQSEPSVSHDGSLSVIGEEDEVAQSRFKYADWMESFQRKQRGSSATQPKDGGGGAAANAAETAVDPPSILTVEEEEEDQVLLHDLPLNAGKGGPSPPGLASKPSANPYSSRTIAGAAALGLGSGSARGLSSLVGGRPQSAGFSRRPQSARPSSRQQYVDALSAQQLTQYPPAGTGAATRAPHHAMHQRPQSAMPSLHYPTHPIAEEPPAAAAASPAEQQLHQRVLSSTAAVEVGGVTVSVYVADTLKRVVEANRWMALLGSTRRYRLKDRLSSMCVELLDFGGAAADGGVPPQKVKQLSLTQFLTVHGKLKGQASASSVGGRGLVPAAAPAAVAGNRGGELYFGAPVPPPGDTAAHLSPPGQTNDAGRAGSNGRGTHPLDPPPLAHGFGSSFMSENRYAPSTSSAAGAQSACSSRNSYSGQTGTGASLALHEVTVPAVGGYIGAAYSGGGTAYEAGTGTGGAADPDGSGGIPWSVTQMSGRTLSHTSGGGGHGGVKRPTSATSGGGSQARGLLGLRSQFQDLVSSDRAAFGAGSKQP